MSQSHEPRGSFIGCISHLTTSLFLAVFFVCAGVATGYVEVKLDPTPSPVSLMSQDLLIELLHGETQRRQCAEFDAASWKARYEALRSRNPDPAPTYERPPSGPTKLRKMEPHTATASDHRSPALRADSSPHDRT